MFTHSLSVVACQVAAFTLQGLPSCIIIPGLSTAIEKAGRRKRISERNFGNVFLFPRIFCLLHQYMNINLQKMFIFNLQLYYQFPIKYSRTPLENPFHYFEIMEFSRSKVFRVQLNHVYLYLLSEATCPLWIFDYVVF